jgi:hypothetical protein
MSTGLAASTVTPGREAPEESFTVPAMLLVCAEASAGHSVDPTSVRIRMTMVRDASEVRMAEELPSGKVP